LKSILAGWVSMKFDTAVVFVLSGITLYFIKNFLNGKVDSAQIVLSVTSLIITLIMGILFLSSIFKIYTGLENLFIQDSTKVAASLVPGRPSLPTTIIFLLVAFSAILTILNIGQLRMQLRRIGIVIMVLAFLPVAGYVSNLPILYYYIPGVNSAMAFHTAVLFILLGTGYLCL